MNKPILERLKSLTPKQLLIILGVGIVLVAIMDTQNRLAQNTRTADCLSNVGKASAAKALEEAGIDNGCE